ncbi:F-box/LRR-repeat protein 15 [Frankliniella fusca]|uniref:F-box/LRR-repeat protein 15 n=1 Tax=Frankliniella fusca TaxID=407009 RepID=A0AAE1L8D7_9NEOP|nr:F-box/LRR-repeat protein 15 [Frankliniella fusca]
MPPEKSFNPSSLEALCLSAVIRCLETDLILCEVARSLQSNSLLLRKRDLSTEKMAEELCDYLAILPGTLSEMVRQKITNKVLAKYAKMSQQQQTSPLGLPLHTMTVRLLEIVLDDEVQTFDLSDFQPALRTAQFKPQQGVPEVWELLLDRCHGLRKFSLPPLLCSTLGINMSGFLKSLAQQCNKLTEIVLKDSVHDSRVLAAIAKHCPSVRVLDISGSNVSCMDILFLIFPVSAKISHEMKAAQLAKLKMLAMQPSPFPSNAFNGLCSSMRDLILTNTKVRALGAYFALKFMPNITTLGDFVFATAVLKKLSQESKCNFALKQIFYRGPTCEKIKLIGASCPDLEILHLGSDDAKRLNFKQLSKLPKLRKLTLELAFPVDIGPELSHLSQLRELQLQVPNVDIGLIVESCPLLQKLVLTQEPLRTVTLSHDKEKPILLSLEELQLECQISLNAAELLLTHAPLLKVVKLIKIRKLTDKVLEKWLKINPLEHLETWLLCYSHLTVRSVSRLLGHCPKLSTLGRLSGWDVRSWESRRLQRTWQEYQINLVHFSHKQNDVSQIMDATVSSDDEFLQ